MFSRNEQGGVAQRLMGGASKKRCNYSADKTGHILMHSCLDDAISSGVKFLMDHELLDIGVVDGKFEGVVLRDTQSGGIYLVLCKALVIATGRYTRIFYNRTSTPFIATGDGVAATLRAGLGFEDLEMIQFYPTGVANGGTLIIEAVRGEEGYLLNNRGERFMKNYHEKMELVRDVVARVIETEIAKVEVMSRDLELMFCAMYTTLGKEKILKDLPKIRHTAMLFENIDLVDTLVLIRLTRIILWVELKWLNLKI